MTYFVHLQLSGYSLPIDIVLLLSLGAVILSFFVYRALGLARRKAVILAVSLWLVSIALLRVVTPRIVLDSLLVEATSMRSLSSLLRHQTRGQVTVPWHSSDIVFTNPLRISSDGHSLDIRRLEQLLTAATGKQCKASYCLGYWDFAFRRTSVGVDVQGAYDSARPDMTP